MRPFGVSLVAAVAQIAAICLARLPIADGTLAAAPRSQLCANAPLTVAGTTFDRRTYMPNSHIEHRHGTKTILWCALGSRTYIILEIVASTAGSAVKAVLETAQNAIVFRIENIGDGPVSSGFFRVGGDENVELYMRNANNHQQTWGVLGAAVGALQDYMNKNGFGQAAFDVFDGGNEVARGTIGIRNSGP